VGANWPFHLDNGRFDERLRLSRVLMNNGRYDRAAAELQQALAIAPHHAVAEFNLGMALVSDGRASEGIPHIRHAGDAGGGGKGAGGGGGGGGGGWGGGGAGGARGARAGAARLLRTYSPQASDDAESCFQVGLLAMDADAPDVAERYLRRVIELRPGDARS